MHVKVFRILESQLFGAPIHHVYESLRAAGNALGHGLPSIVGRVDDDCLHHLFEAKDFPLFQINLRASHLAGPCRDFDGVA